MEGKGMRGRGNGGKREISLTPLKPEVRSTLPSD